ncbi:MAG: siroheme decarboxylase subunit beta [Candidatus Hydrothermarchaeales archaeon]
MKLLDKKDKLILRALQDDIPLVSRPFKAVGENLGIREDEVIAGVKNMLDKGIVRRFSASLRHRKLGIVSNPLCIWMVPGEKVEEVGQKMASFKEVTHCYERPIIPGRWDYNLFTMIHGYDKRDVEKVAEKISKAVGISDYALVFSTKEFKKTYKRY